MAQYSLRRYSGSRGVVWHCRFWGDANKAWRSTGCRTRPEAERWAEQQLQDRTGPGTLAGWCEQEHFFEWGRCPLIRNAIEGGYTFGLAWAKQQASTLRAYILPKFGALRLREIKTVAVRDWLQEMQLSAGTRRHIKNTFSAVMAEAEARELIEFNPIARIKRIGTGYTPRDAFTAADLALLFPSERHKQLAIWGAAVWVSFFHTLATTGLRSGEARALRWGDVLWDRAALVVVRAVKADNSIGSTKTGDGRVVLLLGRTLETLSWWRDQSPTTDPEHYVFLDDRRPIRRDQIRAHLLPAMAAAELNVGGRRLSAHSFRHGFNTMLARAVDAATLRAMTGHKTQAMTDHYDHPLIEDSLRALEPSRGAVEKAIGGNHGEA